MYCKLLCDCFKYFQKRKSFLKQYQILNFIWNTLKYWWNETDDDLLPLIAQFLWTLKFIFSWVFCFRCYLRQLFILLALRKYNRDCKIPKIILVPDFCPLRTELAWFPIGLRLNFFLMIFPSMSLHCKLVPVQYREYECGGDYLFHCCSDWEHWIKKKIY